jgi:serine protease Do
VANAGKTGRKAVLLLIQRGSDQSFVTVPFAVG